MRSKDTIYTVEHEKTRNVFFQGSFAKCKKWLVNRPDWEQYVIVDPLTNQPTGFTLSRKMDEKQNRRIS